MVAFFPNLENKETIGKLKGNCLFQISCKIVFYAHFFPLFIRVGRKQNLQKSEFFANYSHTGFEMNVCGSIII